MAYCDRCELWFPSNRVLKQHKQVSDAHWPCRDCGLDFASFNGLQEHYLQSYNHHYCRECDRLFSFESSKIQHMEAKHWYCRAHDRIFQSEAGLQSHYKQSLDHHICQKCGCDFDDEDELWDHAEEDHHACRPCEEYFDDYVELQEHDRDVHTFYVCPLCEEYFNDYAEFQEHDRAMHIYYVCPTCEKYFNCYTELQEHDRDVHTFYVCRPCEEYFDDYAELQEHDHNVHTYCTDCKRSFQSKSNLLHHLNSKLHQPAIYPCPGRGCSKSFISPAALTLHFESDTCPSRMRREQLNRLVVHADTNNYITNPSRLVTGPLGWNEPPPSKTTWATELSWNGDMYECFLCNATFRTLARLNQHLSSPRHDEKIYRCPKTDCRTEFVTLGGLCQHVEGGSCGVRMFRRVRDTMESLTRGLNMLTV